MKRYFDIVKDMFSIAPGKKWLVAQMFLSVSLRCIASLLPPVATAGIIKVITAGNFSGIWFYVILYVVFYAIYFLATYWNYNTYAKLDEYYHILGQKKIIEKVTNNEEIFNKVSKGKIIDTCSDDVCYIVDVLDCFSEIVIGVIQLVVIFFIFAYYNVYAAIIALLIDIAYLKLMNDNSKAVAKHYEGTRKNNDKIIDLFNQMLLNIRQVKSLNLYPSLSDKIAKTTSKWQEEQRLRRGYLTDRYSKIPIITYLGKIFLYIFLGYLVTKGSMTIDILILLISYFEMVMANTDNILEFLLNLGNYGIRMTRIKTILDVKDNSVNDFGNLENDYIRGLVEFKNVTYQVKGKVILDNVSFKLYPNKINAIVGYAGSGKTTTINLLYRLIRATKGNIYIDNENIYDYSAKVYASNVSGVYQKPYIFNMSVKENLSLINPNPDEQIEACKRVGIHNMIMKLPNGYNTKISEDDKFFDDNKQQLLMIARALLSKAEILLFDEVTSNIDDVTTKKVQTIIKDLKQDHTIVMVTHKPEMMKIADYVVVLDKGKVKAKGTNREVREKSTLYKELRKKEFTEASIVDY